ncbi:MAG TPA: hypothetical protein VFA63_10510, partial [Pseudonocardiaceae bacterium]|nr:hypothetical protein [Pseudonocardiaceae bacterium]
MNSTLATSSGTLQAGLVEFLAGKPPRERLRRTHPPDARSGLLPELPDRNLDTGMRGSTARRWDFPGGRVLDIRQWSFGLPQAAPGPPHLAVVE